MATVANCKYCDAKEKTKLCYCGSIYICGQICWRAYCEKDEVFAAKCKGTMHRLKAKEYESQRKSAAGKKHQVPRGKDGRYQKNPESVPTKTPEQQEKDNVSSAASKQKGFVKKYAKQYQRLMPENKICIKELKKKGKAEIWYCTKGYSPLQSRVASATPIGDESEETEASQENQFSLNAEDSQEGSAPIDEGPPDVEEIQEIVQERKKITIRQFCGICNQNIGFPSKRLKCNYNGCRTHSSLHLSCVGLYPATKEDRIKIQNCYFCSDHRPETANGHQTIPEENSDCEDAPFVSPNKSSGGKNAKKRKKSSVASEENSEKDAPFVTPNTNRSEAKKPRQRKSSSVASPDHSKKPPVSRAPKKSKNSSKSTSHTPKSPPKKSSESSPILPNADNSVPSSFQSASPTMTESSQFSVISQDLNSPSSSSMSEYVTLTLSSDSSFASGSNCAQEYYIDPVGQSTSQFSFSSNEPRTLNFLEM